MKSYYSIIFNQFQLFHRSYSKFISIGIRAETKNRWERRVPLAPMDIEKLIKETGTQVYVESSNKRIFTDDEYIQAGAVVTNNLDKADIIFGVKEIPMKALLPNKTYLFFSHTHKGQSHNMPMLKDIVEKKIRLIDYELMVDKDKNRLVLFSKFAGYAGIMDGLYCLGQRLLGLGYGTPFLHFSMSYKYKSLKDMKDEFLKIGEYIKNEGLPKDFGPFIFGVTGFGNVSKAALELLELLPHTKIKVSDLKNIMETRKNDNKQIFLVLIDAEDHIVTKDNEKMISRKDYLENPFNYKSLFAENIAPYLTFLVNGVYWDARYPRMLTIEQTKQLYNSKKLRLISIADISCDIRGPLEFMSHATTIDKPYFIYDPINNNEHYNLEGNGIQIMSIDNLPTEMPLEASKYFSKSLYPFAKYLAQGRFDQFVVSGATITENGNLKGIHARLGNNINKGNKVLLLGSGYVSGPVVEYFIKKKKPITIASNNLEEAKKLIKNNSHQVEIKLLDINDENNLTNLIKNHDIVISFIPATMHHIIANHCLLHGKPLVTASYVSPLMAKLDEKAKNSKVLLLNELGLDPGIDHMTAKHIIDDAHKQGLKITKFISWCGGLPAPENSDNPLGYKFSWSPKGVLLASQNNAIYKMNGKIIEIPGKELLDNKLDLNIYKGFNFEGLANRDSLKYIDIYGLKSLDTMFRGTLRYKGYSDAMASFMDIGLLNNQDDESINGMEWGVLLNKLLGKNIEELKYFEQIELIKIKLRKLDEKKAEILLENLNWLKLIGSKEKIQNSKSILDAFCKILESKLKYELNERDIIAMHHEFGLENNSGQKFNISSTLILYGDEKSSAMAKTVGLPAAIGANLILEGRIKMVGVQVPVHEEIYKPILEELKNEFGIEMKEKHH